MCCAEKARDAEPQGLAQRQQKVEAQPRGAARAVQVYRVRAVAPASSRVLLLHQDECEAATGFGGDGCSAYVVALDLDCNSHSLLIL